MLKAVMFILAVSIVFVVIAKLLEAVFSRYPQIPKILLNIDKLIGKRPPM